ncbi:MAG: HAD family phosphatase, partial [Candidatus Nanopelagicales bacterium]
MTAPRLQAVLFDMDGLLIDSEPQWFAAETATVAALGSAWGKAQQLDLLGSNLPFAAEYMVRFTNTELSASEVETLLSDNMTEQLRGVLSFQEGAMELLDELASAGITLGLVTSSTREHADVVLEKLPPSLFAVTVTADDVSKLKPHPMPYLTALAALEVSATNAIVLEDSPPGVASGKAAGCHVVAVPSVAAIAPG